MLEDVPSSSKLDETLDGDGITSQMDEILQMLDMNDILLDSHQRMSRSPSPESALTLPPSHKRRKRMTAAQQDKEEEISVQIEDGNDDDEEEKREEFSASSHSATSNNITDNNPMFRHMMEKLPLLVRMANQPEFIKPLSQFQELVIFSNIYKDPSVHYESAAVRRVNPYKIDKVAKKMRSYISGLELPHVFLDDGTFYAEFPDVVALIQEGKTSHFPYYDEMVAGLDRLPWKRYAVVPSSYLAHTDIVVRDPFWNVFPNGHPVVKRIVNLMASLVMN